MSFIREALEFRPHREGSRLEGLPCALGGSWHTEGHRGGGTRAPCPTLCPGPHAVLILTPGPGRELPLSSHFTDGETEAPSHSVPRPRAHALTALSLDLTSEGLPPPGHLLDLTPARQGSGEPPLTQIPGSWGPSPRRCHDNRGPMGSGQAGGGPAPAPPLAEGSELKGPEAGRREPGPAERQARTEFRVSRACRVPEPRRAKAAATMCGECGGRAFRAPSLSAPGPENGAPGTRRWRGMGHRSAPVLELGAFTRRACLIVPPVPEGLFQGGVGEEGAQPRSRTW